MATDQFTPVMMRRLFAPSGHQPNAVSMTSGEAFHVTPARRLIFEGRGIDACRLKAGGKMRLADQAQIGGFTGRLWRCMAASNLPIRLSLT